MGSFLVGAFSLKEKSPTLTVSSFFFFVFFSWQSHSEWSTFLTILQFCAEGKLYSKGSPFQFRKHTQPDVPKGSPLWIFFGILRLKKYFFFEKNFKNNFFEKFFFPNFYNSCSLNIFEPKIWRRLGTFPSYFFFSWQSHSEWSTFYNFHDPLIATLVTSTGTWHRGYGFFEVRQAEGRGIESNLDQKFFVLVFWALWYFFSQNFQCLQRVPLHFFLFCKR